VAGQFCLGAAVEGGGAVIDDDDLVVAAGELDDAVGGGGGIEGGLDGGAVVGGVVGDGAVGLGVVDVVAPRRDGLEVIGDVAEELLLWDVAVDGGGLLGIAGVIILCIALPTLIQRLRKTTSKLP